MSSKPEEGNLQRDYCAGQLSLRKLAGIYGISEGAIRKRAVKNGWVRSEKKSTQSGTQVCKKGTQKGKVRTDSKESEPAAIIQRDCIEPVIDSGENNFTSESHLFGLSEQQALFAEYVVQGRTLVDAYRLAGYQGEGNSAYVTASRLLRNVKVSRYIRHLKDSRQKRYTADLDEIVHQLVSIANADPNELAQHRRVNCRYCWGDNNLYQWIDIGEYDKAAMKASDDGKSSPEYGGVGFIDNADVNPDCPKCHGEGQGQVFIPDSRDLDGNARWLYAGVKETKFGIEVVTASQEAARRDLIRLLGIRGKQENPTGAGGLEDDYKLQALTPDEPTPDSPIL